MHVVVKTDLPDIIVIEIILRKLFMQIECVNSG